MKKQIKFFPILAVLLLLIATFSGTTIFSAGLGDLRSNEGNLESVIAESWNYEETRTGVKYNDNGWEMYQDTWEVYMNDDTYDHLHQTGSWDGIQPGDELDGNYVHHIYTPEVSTDQGYLYVTNDLNINPLDIPNFVLREFYCNADADGQTVFVGLDHDTDGRRTTDPERGQFKWSITYEVVDFLQGLRTSTGEPVIIISGYRNFGGYSHRMGIAADAYVSGWHWEDQLHHIRDNWENWDSRSQRISGLGAGYMGDHIMHWDARGTSVYTYNPYDDHNQEYTAGNPYPYEEQGESARDVINFYWIDYPYTWSSDLDISDIQDGTPEFELSGWSVSPETVESDETVTIEGEITNVGDETGDVSAELYIDGDYESTNWNTLDPSETETFMHTHSESEEGTYDVHIHAWCGTKEGIDDTWHSSFEIVEEDEDEAELVLRDWSIEPEVVGSGETLTIEGQVENIGEETGVDAVELYIDDSFVENESVNVEHGESTTVTFQHSEDDEGTYDVRVEFYQQFDDRWESEFSVEEEDPGVEYRLTIGSTDGGSVVEPVEGTHTYEGGDVVELEAVADEGYKFVNWTGDDGTIDDTLSNSTTITMEDDHDITAHFEEIEEEVEFELVIEAEEGGTTIPEPDTYTYTEGEDVTVEAIPEDDRVFSHWEGDVPEGEEEKSEITITMDDNKQITAHFLREPFFELDIVDYNKEVVEGEEVVVEYTVTNTGEIQGRQTIEFRVDGELKDSEEITLGSDEVYEGNFTWQSEENGTFELEIISHEDEDEESTTSITVSVIEEEQEEDPFIVWWSILLFAAVVIIVLAFLMKREKA